MQVAQADLWTSELPRAFVDVRSPQYRPDEHWLLPDSHACQTLLRLQTLHVRWAERMISQGELAFGQRRRSLSRSRLQLLPRMARRSRAPRRPRRKLPRRRRATQLFTCGDEDCFAGMLPSVLVECTNTRGKKLNHMTFKGKFFVSYLGLVGVYTRSSVFSRKPSAPCSWLDLN